MCPGDKSHNLKYSERGEINGTRDLENQIHPYSDSSGVASSLQREGNSLVDKGL